MHDPIFMERIMRHWSTKKYPNPRKIPEIGIRHLWFNPLLITSKMTDNE